MPIVYRERYVEADRLPGFDGEALWIGAAGLFARVERDARRTWRGRVWIRSGYVHRGVRRPADVSQPALSYPARVGEGELVALVERDLRRWRAAIDDAASPRWYETIPPNCPAPAPAR